MNMAIFEAKLLACMLLQKFTFTLREGEAEKISYGIGVTMCICNNKDATDPDERTHELWLVPTPRVAGGGNPAEDVGDDDDDASDDEDDDSGLNVDVTSPML